MSERLDQLNTKLEASRNRPGYDARVKAIEEEIERVRAEEGNVTDPESDDDNVTETPQVN